MEKHLSLSTSAISCRILLWTTILALSSCEANNTRKDMPQTLEQTSTTLPSKQNIDAKALEENFRRFRDAVYRNDKEAMAGFIDFPIMNEGNEIWYLVYGGDESRLSQLTEKIRPFTEKDFYAHSDRLFPAEFVQGILKIKAAALCRGESVETTELRKDSLTMFLMSGSVDFASASLHLALNTTEKVKDETGEQQDDIEFSVMYEFNITDSGRIRLKQVRLAG
jgi:hypothetical protein